MDSRHIQPFVDEIIKTLDLMLGVTVRRVGEEEREGAEGVHELSATVGLSGPATGGMVLSMPRSAAREIASRLIGKQVDESSPDVEDVVGELANVVSARAKRALEKEGLVGLSFSLPHVVVGEGRGVWLSRELPCVSVSLVTDEFGPFRIEISVRPVEEGRSPRAAAAEDPGRAGSEAATPGVDTGEGPTAMKILVVDDSVIVGQFMADVMKDIDDIPVELIRRATGPEALATVEEHGSSIDLILCDLRIPGIDGLTVLEKVKTTTDARAACFVMITGDTSDETVAKAIKGGAAGVLVKPFGREEVVGLVRKVHSRLALGLPTSTAAGLPLFGPASGASGESPPVDRPPRDEGPW